MLNGFLALLAACPIIQKLASVYILLPTEFVAESNLFWHVEIFYTLMSDRQKNLSAC